MGALTFNPYGFALFTALGIAVAPFAAAAGAIFVPSEESVADAHQALTSAIQATDWAPKLQAAVDAAIRQRTVPAPPAGEGRLGLWFEGPWLVVYGGSAVPTLTVHGELLVADDCIADRRWRWNGDGDDFVDLGEDNAQAFRKQMALGVTELAKAIAGDLFLATEARRVAYKDKDSFTRGGPPLAVLVPDDHQNVVVSWVITDGATRTPRCAGLRSLAHQQSGDRDTPHD